VHQPLLFVEPAGTLHVVLDEHGLVTYDRDFLDAQTADELLRELLGVVAWKQEHLRLYGRAIPFPRLTAWYGDPGAVYTYSGIVNEPRAWTAGLARLRDRLYVALGVRFNSALLNLYRTGSDGMGWHADDEPELGRAPADRVGQPRRDAPLRAAPAAQRRHARARARARQPARDERRDAALLEAPGAQRDHGARAARQRDVPRDPPARLMHA
jgi:hypothetical protein